MSFGVANAVDTINRALAPLSQEDRTRALLSAAVLFGVIKPGESDVVPPIQRRPPRLFGDSIRERVAQELARLGTASASTLAINTQSKLESARALLSKLVAEGTAKRVGVGMYQHVEPDPCSTRAMATKDSGPER